MKTSRGFEDLLAYFNARGVEYLVVGAQPVSYLGREELIRYKRAAGRSQDLADLEWLERGDVEPG